MPGRREFLKSTACAFAAALLPVKGSGSNFWEEPEQVVEALPPWEPGVLEIHHIDTGRGNSTLVLCPDGTSILIDAGEAHSPERLMVRARPNATRRAGEWIARYVQRQLGRINRQSLDVMLLTHFHGDHVGEVSALSPTSTRGPYKLTGAADVAETIPIDHLIDRGWPDYRYPAPPTDATSLNYIALAKSLAGRGTNVERARAGGLKQLALRRDKALYPHFNARILAANGVVWTGRDETSKRLFPSLEGLPAAAFPTENICSIAVLLQHGAFRYYTGGDLTCDTDYGRYPWHDIEIPVAQLAGPVSVAVANHHGYYDACGPAAVHALQPHVWILPSWHASHPAMNAIANMFSQELYTGERSVFSTGITPEALVTNERFLSKLSSSDGHVVVRVPAAGREFTVNVVDVEDESGTVMARFGPFPA